MNMRSDPLVPIGERFHDLDAVRAFALMLGVALHGVMSFMTPRFWIVGDVVQDTGANVAFYAIHIFRMTTFFVLAGFFARMLMQKRGVGGFITNRLKRIAAPLVIFWPLVFVAIVAMLIIANMPLPGVPAPPPPPTPAMTASNFPLTHLWFLYALLLLYVGAVVVKLVTDVLHVGGALGGLLDKVVGLLTKSDLITLLLAAPVATAFYFNDKWMMWLGVQTPDTGLIPNALAVAAFTTAFVFGWWLNRRSDLLDHLASRFWVYGITAAVGTWWCLSQAGAGPTLETVVGREHALYAVIYPLTSWSWTFAFIGLARVVLKKENPMIRYISDASYWVFIVHLPLLLVFQYFVKDLHWEVEYKATIVIGGTLLVGLLTYQLMVRYSFIGTILNGRRRKVKAIKETQEAMA